MLRKLGGRQFTLRFWIPEAAFGGGGVGLFESIETADTLELMGYLTATHGVRQARPASAPARCLAEGCAVEAEHRAIARFAQTALGGRQQISIDRSFAPWGDPHVRRDDRALEANGIGFGAQGAAPGRVLRLPRRPGGERRRAASTTAASRTSPTRCPPRNGRPGGAPVPGRPARRPGTTPRAVAPLLTKPCHRSHAAITSVRSNGCVAALKIPARIALVALAAMAATLGLTTAEVSAHASQPGGIGVLAAQRGVEPAHVRAVAAAAVEPVLGEAIRSGELGADQGRAIRWRIQDRGLA